MWRRLFRWICGPEGWELPPGYKPGRTWGTEKYWYPPDPPDRTLPVNAKQWKGTGK